MSRNKLQSSERKLEFRYLSLLAEKNESGAFIYLFTSLFFICMGKQQIFSSVLLKSLLPGLRSFLLLLHSLHGATVGQNRASIAAAMPLLIYLLLKSAIGSTIDNIISHLQQVAEQMQSRQALTRHSSCGSTSPGNCSMKKSIHFHGMFFPKNCLCAWIGIAHTSLALIPTFLLLHLACSHTTTSL